MLDELFQLSRRFIRLYHRDYRRYFLSSSPLESRFSIITGSRGVGKTTLMMQVLADFSGGDFLSPEILYIQSDHFSLGRFALYEIAEQFVNENGKLICFDEIHKYSNWSGELKSINDTFPGLKIIASGSSALEIHKGSHDLSRRGIVYHLQGMSFREFLELNLGLSLASYSLPEILSNHQSIALELLQKLEEKQTKVLLQFKHFLNHGCYPYFTEYPNKDLFHITLEQNIHTTIESDLPAVFPGLTGSGVKKVKKLLAYIAESVPFTPDLKGIKRLLDIGDERTLKHYLKYLEDAGIIRTVSKKGKGLAQLEKPEKIFLDNPNLMHAVGRAGGANKGSLRETFFLYTAPAAGKHTVTAASRGDFVIDGTYTFEVGGKGKRFHQIKDLENSFLALDDIEAGSGNKIPLWLFGFLY